MKTNSTPLLFLFALAGLAGGFLGGLSWRTEPLEDEIVRELYREADELSGALEGFQRASEDELGELSSLRWAEVLRANLRIRGRLVILSRIIPPGNPSNPTKEDSDDRTGNPVRDRQ